MYRCLIIAVIVTAFGLSLVSPLTAAENTSIKSFYGTFKGSGIAENSDSLYFGVMIRDFDVTIGPSSSGFDVVWTAVIRSGGDPAKPNIRKKTLHLSFAPTKRANVFNAIDAKNPLDGKPFSWARIDGQTLTVYMLIIRDDGGYEVQSYARTLTAQGMNLVFERVRDGDKVRTVKGKLVKYAE